jgi:hypothetical protein
VFETYPDECQAKKASSKFITDDAGLVQQLVAEISSQRPALQKRQPELKTTEGRPRKYYYSEKSHSAEVAAAEAGQAAPAADAATGKLRDCVTQDSNKRTKLWSFEVKLLINRSNVREVTSSMTAVLNLLLLLIGSALYCCGRQGRAVPRQSQAQRLRQRMGGRLRLLMRRKRCRVPASFVGCAWRDVSTETRLVEQLVAGVAFAVIEEYETAAHLGPFPRLKLGTRANPSPSSIATRASCKEVGITHRDCAKAENPAEDSTRAKKRSKPRSGNSRKRASIILPRRSASIWWYCNSLSVLFVFASHRLPLTRSLLQTPAGR